MQRASGGLIEGLRLGPCLGRSAGGRRRWRRSGSGRWPAATCFRNPVILSGLAGGGISTQRGAAGESAGRFRRRVGLEVTIRTVSWQHMHLAAEHGSATSGGVTGSRQRLHRDCCPKYGLAPMNPSRCYPPSQHGPRRGFAARRSSGSQSPSPPDRTSNHVWA